MDEPDIRRFDFEVGKPSRRPVIWALGGFFGILAGALGVYLGGDIRLGIPIIGLSAVISFRALSTYVGARKCRWFVSAAVIDVPRGILTLVESDVTSDDERTTDIPLGTMRSTTIESSGGGSGPFRCEMLTELFIFEFPPVDRRAEAEETQELLELAAKRGPKVIERPRTGRFAVDRDERRSTIRWRQPRLWPEYLKVASHLAFLVAATPLLDVWYGVPFALVALGLGVIFVRNLRRVWRAERVRKWIEITPDGMTHGPSIKETIAIDVIDEVGPVLVFASAPMGALVEARAGTRWEDEMERRMVTGTETWLEDLGDATKWDLVKMMMRAPFAMLRGYVNMYDDLWVASVSDGGFREALDLSLLIREELTRVAEWTPPFDEDPLTVR